MKGKNKKEKQRVLVLNLDRTFEEKTLPREGGQIEDKQGAKVNFSPDCVFDEKDKKRLRKKRKLVLFVEGTTQALKFKETKDPTDPENPKLQLDDLNPFWTVRQAKEFVDKQITESLEQHKPMTWLQYIIMLAVMVIILGVVVMGFSNMGAL